MSLTQLSAMLDASAQPFLAFASTRFVQLYLYVHRVDGLEPGVYRHWPDTGELEIVRPGDQRVVASGLRLGQDLADNACVAFSMIADIDRAVRAHGDRGYRYVHFEAGAIGRHLYLAAEALGWERRASARSLMMKCTVISTWRAIRDRWCTSSRSVMADEMEDHLERRAASLRKKGSAPTKRPARLRCVSAT